jgi:chromosomal replication initiation ATPase DnaA
MTIWDQILERIRARIPEEDFRRWFGATAYASDSGDQLTVWVPTESIRRHISVHYENSIDHALTGLGRKGTRVRLVVSGGEDEEEEE